MYFYLPKPAKEVNKLFNLLHYRLVHIEFLNHKIHEPHENGAQGYAWQAKLALPNQTSLASKLADSPVSESPICSADGPAWAQCGRWPMLVIREANGAEFGKNHLQAVL